MALYVNSSISNETAHLIESLKWLTEKSSDEIQSIALRLYEQIYEITRDGGNYTIVIVDNSTGEYNEIKL